jgi:choline dehydrogenase-like flavoprotein
MPSATTNGTNGTNGINGHHKSALCSVDEFLEQSYDYLVIGGGTAGLCVAARLTENPNVTVGVLEGGENRLDDKNVLTPSLFPTLPGRPEYDWMMESIPQVSWLSSKGHYFPSSGFVPYNGTQIGQRY